MKVLGQERWSPAPCGRSHSPTERPRYGVVESTTRERQTQARHDSTANRDQTANDAIIGRLRRAGTKIRTRRPSSEIHPIGFRSGAWARLIPSGEHARRPGRNDGAPSTRLHFPIVIESRLSPRSTRRGGRHRGALDWFSSAILSTGLNSRRSTGRYSNTSIVLSNRSADRIRAPLPRPESRSPWGRTQ